MSALQRAAARWTSSGSTSRKPFALGGQVLQQVIGQFPEALHFVVGGAQEGVEDHALQVLHPVFQGDLAVHLVEVHGVGQAGPQHPFVTLAHQVRVSGQGVVHRQKMRQELAILAPQGKIALVLTHGGDEHFVGQGQEFVVKIGRRPRREIPPERYFLQGARDWAPLHRRRAGQLPASPLPGGCGARRGPPRHGQP